MKSRGILFWAVMLVGVVASCGVSLAASAPDAGRPFGPQPVSQPVYDIKAPDEDPATQKHFVAAHDGVEIYVETWLPKEKDGRVPPSRVPTILLASPYWGHVAGGIGVPVVPYFVPRGYAFSFMHVRGTGNSGGCIQLHSSLEADDGARVVEYLGRDASWSDGNVAMWGVSYDGGMAVAVAALGDQSRTKYLKAIVPHAPAVDWYDIMRFDGVPYIGWQSAVGPNYIAYSALLGREFRLTNYAKKPECWAEHEQGTNNNTGNYTPYDLERDSRRGIENIRAATLVTHGHPDENVPAVVQSGFFDRLPASTPKAGAFGIWPHALPSNHPTMVPDWERPDWLQFDLAWFDQYLKGLDAGVENWPIAQVQGSDGQWRAEPDWPTTGGPVGQLALAPSKLGGSQPTGSSSYTELSFATFENTQTGPPPGSFATFETAPLPERLELTGQPVLDAWVTLDKPDAHLAARIEALDATGERIPNAVALGFRSMRHLDPLLKGRFAQSEEKLPPVNKPVQVTLRFGPTSLVVPKGGRLKLTLAGSLIRNKGLGEAAEEYTPVDPPEGATIVEGPTQPSGETTRVTVLHDCDHPSALRFVMPRTEPDLLNVREKDEPEDRPLADNSSAPPPVSDGGGLAMAPICGEGPKRTDVLGPERGDGRQPGR